MLPKSLNILLHCFAEFCISSQFVCAGIGFTVYMINLADVSKLCVHENSINIGIKHGFPCINVYQVPREMLKTEAVGRGFQHLPRDLVNVNVLENNV